MTRPSGHEFRFASDEREPRPERPNHAQMRALVLSDLRGESRLLPSADVLLCETAQAVTLGRGVMPSRTSRIEA